MATLAADLHRAGLFPVLVFTGANSPTTAARFPRGEAVHYAEHAITLGVPPSAIIIEPEAANTGQNIDFARRALAAAQITVSSVLLISKPYMQRRAFATARKLWPDVGALRRSARKADRRARRGERPLTLIHPPRHHAPRCRSSRAG